MNPKLAITTNVTYITRSSQDRRHPDQKICFPRSAASSHGFSGDGFHVNPSTISWLGQNCRETEFHVGLWRFSVDWYDSMQEENCSKNVEVCDTWQVLAVLGRYCFSMQTLKDD
ncbi:uncharacterized protein LOC130709916 isoform X2 [Lotus japonicus]|uniref:uncharacterized protein LOC130709916 isoform X2 n=1 Tax=Lotus japonicus TaxID=34305 RepID=UPI0025866EDE|nr:uncharacterized protein LOC130709916 isoform X2 [Lotus japonicus]